MSINKDVNIQALMTNFNASFDQALSVAPQTYKDYASIVPNGTKTGTYAFFLDNPRMREWVGPKQIKNIQEKAIVVANRHFEMSVGVNIDDINDDNLGIYKMHFASLAEKAGMLPDDLCAAALEGGTSTLGFDGQNFFDTDHEDSQSNSLSLALTADNFATAMGTFRSFKLNGKNLGVGLGVPNLVVPVTLEYQAKAIVNASINAAGATNILQGAAKVVVNPALTDSTRWYLTDSGSVKPVVYQERDAVHLTSLDINGEHARKENEWLWSAEARGEAFLSLWFLALTSKP